LNPRVNPLDVFVALIGGGDKSLKKNLSFNRLSSAALKQAPRQADSS
jgi:hypothetical protein